VVTSRGDVDEFERLRPRVFGLASRMLGSVASADRWRYAVRLRLRPLASAMATAR
jgi:hypothetical protein